MIKTKLLKTLRKYKLDFSIHADDVIDLEFIYSRRHTKAFKNIMYYNPPYNLVDLYTSLFRCYEIGARFSLEKYKIMYGDEDGVKKFYESNLKKGHTLDKMKQRYGDEEGAKKWKIYCDRQAYTNTLEYKHKKHGWTPQKFSEYNNSRSQTLDKMKQRYGDEEGAKKWKIYCDRQAYTNTLEYLGEAKYKEVNRKKSHTLEVYQERYGENKGYVKYLKHINKVGSGYSKISQELFDTLITCVEFRDKTCYYATHNNEYGIYDEFTKSYKKYDFVCLEYSLCIEFHGDHYHGNPKIYKPKEYLNGRGMSKTTAEEKWKVDREKQNLIEKERNMIYIVVWEGDYKMDKQKVVNRIIDYVRSINI